MSYLFPLSHKKFEKVFDIDLIIKLSELVRCFERGDLVDFTPVTDSSHRLIYIPDVPLSSLPDSFVSNLDSLKSLAVANHDEYVLSTCELHFRRSISSHIPPHQDNFYHCFNSFRSFKFLVPIVPITALCGGLVYADIFHDHAVLAHVPSFEPAFSSVISPSILSDCKLSFSSYSLDPGDAVFHSINSIHYAPPNYSTTDTCFLIFRFDHSCIEVDDALRSRYRTVYSASNGILEY